MYDLQRWLGVDVGGRRKGFDAALLEKDRVVEIRSRQSVKDLVAWTAATEPTVIAIDSPCASADPGWTHRPEEKALRKAVCGIRWTPAAERLALNPYYEWIVEGMRLYEALESVPAEVIECFPTASWTRWAGARGVLSRSLWTRNALMGLGLADVPTRTNQDKRDAIAAAVTARDYARGHYDAFGAIIVPRAKSIS